MTDLSVIIPAYNEAARIQDTLDTVVDHLSMMDLSAEVIIVENGSTDKTARLVREYMVDQSASWPGPGVDLLLIQLDYPDKGRAITEGMLAANGRLRYMADADLSTPIELINGIIRHHRAFDADITIVNRDPIIGQTKIRQVMSSGFSAAASLLLGDEIRDSQAGFKLFSAEAAQLIFTQLKVMGWAFDVEVIYLAQRMGLEISQVNQPWQRQPGSKIKLFTPARMLLDLIRIKWAHGQAC